MSRTREFRIWNLMIQRCTNPGNGNYHYYGGRGIRVCDRWRESFGDFLADIGRAPSPGHTIDRIDNDGDYEPGNCRWATQSQQARNTRANHFVTHRGRTQTVIEWCEETGIKKNCLLTRLRRGWSAEKALTAPVQEKNSRG
jgi:hypothetical protein